MSKNTFVLDYVLFTDNHGDLEMSDPIYSNEIIHGEIKNLMERYLDVFDIDADVSVKQNKIKISTTEPFDSIEDLISSEDGRSTQGFSNILNSKNVNYNGETIDIVYDVASLSQIDGSSQNGGSIRRKSIRRKTIRRKSIRRKSIRRKSIRRKSLRK